MTMAETANMVEALQAAGFTSQQINDLAIYQLVVDIYKFPKHLYSGLLMALA